MRCTRAWGSAEMRRTASQGLGADEMYESQRLGGDELYIRKPAAWRGRHRVSMRQGHFKKGRSELILEAHNW